MGLSTGIKAFNLHGSTLIYDPDLQLPNCVHTFLWATDEGAVDRYQTAIIGIVVLFAIMLDAYIKRRQEE